jgi:hypothetical protein
MIKRWSNPVKRASEPLSFSGSERLPSTFSPDKLAPLA